MDFEINSEKLSSVIDSIISGVCVFSVNEKQKIVPVYINEGLYRMLGYTHKEFEKIIANIRSIIIPDDLPVFDNGIDEILKDNGAVEFVFRTVTLDGGIRWLQVRGNLYGKMDGYPLLAGVILDATERKSIEEELALQAERMNILSETAKEHLVDYNSRTDVLNIKLGNNIYKTGEKIVTDFIAKKKFDGIHPEDKDILFEVINAARMNPISDSIEFRCTAFEEPSDKYNWYRATISSVRGADGYVSRIVGRISNIDEEKKREEELRIKADRDGLTGLYNKGAATTLIMNALQKCTEEGTKSALLMIDLDHFKSVNDTFGHAVGDRVLEDAGRILNDSFKGRDIVGRMGGDEFMILMNDIKGSEDAMIIAEKLNAALTRIIEISGSLVTVTASIGIAVYDSDLYETENTTENDNGYLFKLMYERADSALYKTKEKGRNGCTLYE